MTKRTQKITAIYIRVSTFDKQESGLASQKRALNEYVENHGFKNVKLYIDRMTGSKLDRPQFQKLQTDVFAGTVKTIIVWKLDRVSRTLKDGISVLTDWLEANIRVISITQQLDFNDAVGKLAASVLFAVAEMERENIRENVKRGIVARQKAGKSFGGSKRGRMLKTNPEQVRGIMQMRDAGTKMCDIAAATGLHRTTVYRIVKNVEAGVIQV